MAISSLYGWISLQGEDNLKQYQSWGAYPKVEQSVKLMVDRFSSLPEGSILPYGLGRSYGDVCLNSQGSVVSSENLNHFIHFDHHTGLLRCEAGVNLGDILKAVVPKGWFLSCTPGTKFVTVAGAIANDVHGKNHHLAASFGNHVTRFELLRSDGTRFICSDSENSELFYATIGGLGLTGFIVWAEIQLKAVESASMDVESIKYNHLQDFFTIAEDSEAEYEYTAVWLDSSATGANLGRGHFLRGNHTRLPALLPINSAAVFEDKNLTFPITPPISLVNNVSVKAFNHLYYQRQKQAEKSLRQNFDPFFYPLDGILQWNRVYGRKGFLQYQCIVPNACAYDSIKELLEKISSSGKGSFLVVLKTMGDITSQGLLSFSRSGANLAIDFPYQGQKTLDLLAELDKTVLAVGGALYPAKDARMSAKIFQQAYPRWLELNALKDPNIQSDFWQRVTTSV